MLAGAYINGSAYRFSWRRNLYIWLLCFPLLPVSATMTTTLLYLTFPILLAPATRNELFQRHGIVAVLLPSGKAAVEGFSDLVDQILLAPRASTSPFILDRQCFGSCHIQRFRYRRISGARAGKRNDLRQTGRYMGCWMCRCSNCF